MHRDIGIIFGWTTAPVRVFRETAMGISDYAQRANLDWQFHLVSTEKGAVEGGIGRTALHGAIAVGLLERDLPALEPLRKRSIPLLHAGESPPGNRLHEICLPNFLVGSVCAEHLLDRGVRSFAFIGDGRWNARRRAEGFAARLAQAGIRDVPIFFRPRVSEKWFAQHLPRLTPTLGVMAANDWVGMSITLAAFRLRIRIPEQLAVISVGDEEPWCALSTPPLSSFAFPGFAIGQRAAQTLRALMDGDSPPTQPVAAGRIVERQSTARASTSNPEIASAIRIIRQHRGVGITIADVANSVGISRSTLERGVCEAIGISPVKEMIRLRLGAAKEMLSTTDAPAKVVAQRCGFADAKYFSTAFRAATGMTPTQYRNQQRGYLLADPAAAPSKDH